MAFQLLTTTTTVWIIHTVFQPVSSGIKNIFHKSSYELLIAGFPTYHKVSAIFAFKRYGFRLQVTKYLLPLLLRCYVCYGSGVRIYAFKRGIAHPVSSLRRTEMV